MNRQERNTGPSVRRNITNRDFPGRPSEIQGKSDALAQRLIADPTLLWQVNQIASERELIAGSKSHTFTGETFSRIGKTLDSFDWTTRHEERLTADAAGAILDHLPSPMPQGEGKRSTRERVAIKLARGYLDRRFETQEGSADWRGSLRTLHTMLDAAATPQPNMDRLKKWFAMTTGHYQEVVPLDSVPWRAMFYGTRAVHPNDGEILAATTEMNNARFLLSEIIDRKDLYGEHTHNPYVVRLSAAIDVFNDATKAAAVADAIQYRKETSDSGSGRRLRIDPSQHIAAIENLLKERQDLFGDVDPDEVMAHPFTRELMELVLQMSNNQERLKAVEQLTPSRMNLEEIREVPISDKATLELYNLLFRKTESLQAISTLFEPSLRGQRIQEVIQQNLEDTGEEGYEIYPFVIGGVHGYFATPEDLSGDIVAQKQRMRDFYERERIANAHEALQQTAASVMPFSKITSETGEMMYLVASEFGALSDLAQVLDERIPDEVREKAFEYFQRNEELRKDMPSRITRVPTTGGDKYKLHDHPDLPGIFDDAIIKKTKQGLRYALRFIPNAEGSETYHLQGEFSALNNMLHIVPDSENPRVSTDQAWIIESVLLQLIERSMCPPEAEVESEITGKITELQKRGKLEGYPGFIGHIGLFRGVPKNYTPQAEANLAEALKTMNLDLPGFNLAVINARHKKDDPNDKRNLTWYKGVDIDEQHAVPTLREAPGSLLPALTAIID